MKTVFTVLLLCSMALGQEQGKKIPLEQIANDFSSNAVRAEMLYGGKSIVVEGTILSIGTYNDGRFKSQVARIEFQPSREKVWPTSNSWMCGFDAANLKEIYNVKNGDTVTLSGQFATLWNLQHCTVIADKPAVATTAVLDPKLGFFRPTHNDGCPTPIEAVKMTPRLYPFRVSTPGEEGWRPLNRMALDLTVRNVSSKDIAAMSFQLNYPDRLHPRMVPTGWDDVPVGIKAGEEYTLHFPNLVDILGGANAVTVTLTKIRYRDGMIVDIPFCDLGEAPFTPPVQSSNAIPQGQLPAKDANFSRYVDIIKRTIAANWYSRQADPKASLGHSVIVTFVVHRDGTVSDRRIAKSSGVPSLDLSAIQAVERVSAFEPLPSGYPGTSASVSYTFTYDRNTVH